MPQKTIITYKPICEVNEYFLLEYAPPTIYTKLAIISITILKDISVENIVTLVEAETNKWIKKYPISTVTNTYFKNGDTVELITLKSSNSYLCYFDIEKNLILATWDYSIKPNNVYYVENDLNGMFEEFKIIKEYDPDFETKKQNNKLLQLRVTMVILFCLIPIIYEVISYTGNILVSNITMGFALYTAIIAGLKILRLVPETKKEKELAEINRKKEHYYMHCERNPEGFNKLKFEIIRRDEERKTEKLINDINRVST